MTKEEIIDLAEYYRYRHNSICQDDFRLPKPDYDNTDMRAISNKAWKEFLEREEGDKNDWCNVWTINDDRSDNFCCILFWSTVFITQIHRS